VRDPGVGRRDTEHDPAYHGFARAGFAHEPDNLSGANLQRYPPQKPQRGPHVEAQIQVTDIEQRIHRLCTGSIASRNPSPSALSPSTATIMQLIGAAISHQAWFTYSRPSWMRLPQVGIPDETDNPTNERMASTTMAMPISSVNNVSSSGATLGRISLARMRMGPRPMVTAEAT